MIQWLTRLLHPDPLAARMLLLFALALALLCALPLVSPWQGKALDWIGFILIGATIPLAAISRRLPSLALTLDLGFVLLGSVALLHTPTPVLIALVAIQLAALTSFRLLKPTRSLSPRGIHVFLFGFALAFFVRLSWITPFTQWIRSPVTALVFATAVIFCWYSLCSHFKEHATPTSRTRLLTTLATFVAFSLFTLAAFSHQRLFDAKTYGDVHNWGVYLSSVLLVRQGGWLLWDVPSQYGFLSTLSIAALPFDSAWQSMYVLNSLFQLASSILLFKLLKSLTSPLLALLVTWTAVFLLPGYYPELAGPQSYPSTGALRFFWVEAVVFWAVWSSVIRPTSAQKRLRVGMLLWFAGILWSAESAVYCSAVWFPCLLLEARFPRLRRYLLLPPALVSLTVAGIELYYRARLGHGPDWTGYAEYVHTFKSGTLAGLVSASSSVWVALVVLCAIGASLDLKNRATAIAGSSAFFAAWVVTSYFMGRGHDNNMVNLSAIFALTLAYLIRFPSLRPVSAAYFAMLLALALSDFPRLGQNLRELAHLPATRIEERLPRLTPEVTKLMDEAQVGADAAILSYETYQDFSPIRDPAVDHGMPRAWLPLPSLALLAALPPERRQLYLKRFAERRPMSGWLLRRKDSPLPSWISDPLEQTHRLTLEKHSAEWLLSHWVPRS